MLNILKLFLALFKKKEQELKKDQLGYFFSFKEMTKSQIATRHGIKNIPNKKQTENLKHCV